ncbi:MAG TPA: hypothetical protein VKF36_22335 [Syntrophorhabdales bacterium]|nr:hypothetical protein [Syntrophorhabdales bacterium]
MSKRNKKRHSIPSPSVPAGGGIEKKVPLGTQEAFRPVFERALDFARSKLYGSGVIDPTVLFVYGKGPEDGELKESTTKVVSIRWKDEFQKEAMRVRIREKAEREGAVVVVLLMPGEAAKPQEGTLLIAGAIPGMTADASVTYAFDRETRTFSFSELAWRNEPERNFFLEGLFGAAPKTG